MIPDLGKYAVDVLSAYLVALVLLFALVALSLRQSTKARTALKCAEKQGNL